MTVVSRLMGAALGTLPPSAIRRAARQYLAGATVDDAMRAVRELASAGMTATVAVLGEAAATPDYAASQVRELHDVLDAVSRSGLDVRLGVKLTGLGLCFDTTLAMRHLVELAAAAEQADCVLEVDMEQVEFVDLTLDAVRTARMTHSNVEAVIQAELRRSAADIAKLVAAGIPTRIVKGTYKEGPQHSYQLPEVIRESYLSLVRRYLEAGLHVGVATHDEYLVYRVLRHAEELGVTKNAFEFQMIMGIQEPLRASLVASGYTVRVTVNFGVDAHKWSIRRLKENPEMARYVLAGMRESARDRLIPGTRH